jgi:outer membrane lipoprotein SlyB
VLAVNIRLIQAEQEPTMKRPIDYTTASLAAGALACALLLGLLVGCGPQNGEPVAAPAKTAAAPVPRADIGQVSSIETLTERPKGTGVGAVAGGVLGGVVGHQVGGGDGQKVATAAGAIGGAVLGNKIERDRAEHVVGYRVNVRLENGDLRSFQRTELTGMQVGDRVRVRDGQISPA